MQTMEGREEEKTKTWKVVLPRNNWSLNARDYDNAVSQLQALYGSDIKCKHEVSTIYLSFPPDDTIQHVWGTVHNLFNKSSLQIRFKISDKSCLSHYVAQKLNLTIGKFTVPIMGGTMGEDGKVSVMLDVFDDSFAMDILIGEDFCPPLLGREDLIQYSLAKDENGWMVPCTPHIY